MLAGLLLLPSMVSAAPSRSFNGTSDKVNFGLTCTESGDWSMTAFIKTPSSLPATNRSIWDLSGGTPGFNQNYDMEVRYADATKNIAIGSSADSYIRAKSATVPATSTFYFVVGTFNSTSKVYTVWINGVSDGTATGTVLPPTSGTNFLLFAGASDGDAAPANFWSGNISHVAVYNRVLTTQEINQLKFFPGSITKGACTYAPLWGGSPEGDYVNNVTGALTGTATSATANPIGGVFVIPSPGSS